MNFVIVCLIFAMLRIASGQVDVIVEKDTKRNHLNDLIMKPSSRQRSAGQVEKAPVLTVTPSNPTCQNTRDCLNLDENMDCYGEHCYCKQGYVLIYGKDRKCFRRASWEEECMYDKQCKDNTRNSQCRDGLCSCINGYFYNGLVCSPRTPRRSKATEVYTAALVAISCIMVAVTCILVGCVVKKSSQLRNYQSRPSEQSRGSDVFTIAEEIAAVRAADKPPTYDEVMRNEQIQFGIPPPDYPSSSSSLSYSSPVPGPSRCSLEGTFLDHNCDSDGLPSGPPVHDSSDSSCCNEVLAQRTNDTTGETCSNVTIELETNNNSYLQTVPPSSLLAQQHNNQVNASSVTDGELGAYANLAFSLDV